MTGEVEVEVVVEAEAELGEGPVWDDRTGVLVWVDILGRKIHLTDPSTGCTESIGVPLDVGAVAPRVAGGYIAALQDGFWIVDDGIARRVAVIPEASSRLRFNDGKCDPEGRFWAGTMAYDKAPGAACLYRLELDGSVSRVLDHVTISNGLAWKLDGTSMFYIDTPTHRIDAFTVSPTTGDIGDRRPLVQVPSAAGSPDGMAIDSEGGLWVALWDGAAIHRYLDGHLDRVVSMPVTRPTSCAFGGQNLDELFVTSAWSGLGPDERKTQPLAGSLFRIRTGVQGLPAAFYGKR